MALPMANHGRKRKHWNMTRLSAHAPTAGRNIPCM